MIANKGTSVMTKLIKRACNSMLTRITESFFTIHTYSVRQSADLYKGCQFNCAYCFAASYKRNTLAEQVAFGTKIEFYANGPLTLEHELKALLGDPDRLTPIEYTILGTTTDSYQPAEQRYRLTRMSLKACLRVGSPVTVLTKSSLCLRDIDLWSELAKRDLGAIGFTLTTPSCANSPVKRVLETMSPPPSEILRTLELFTSAGIRTYVFVDPIIPFITDDEYNLSQLVREIANTGNQKVHFGVLKLTPGTWRRLKPRLNTYNPEVVPLIEDFYFQDGVIEFRDSWLPPSNYRRQLYTYLRDECQSAGLGFSCEGGDYDLWLDDWASIQDPYRHPTGYNLWKVIRKHNSDFVTLPQMLTELSSQFNALSPAYKEKLSELWRNRLLFARSGDIGWDEQDNATVYYYKAEHPTRGYRPVLPLMAYG